MSWAGALPMALPCPAERCCHGQAAACWVAGDAASWLARAPGARASVDTKPLRRLAAVQESLLRVLPPISTARVFLTSYPYNPGALGARLCRPPAACIGEPAAATAFARNGRPLRRLHPGPSTPRNCAPPPHHPDAPQLRPPTPPSHHPAASPHPTTPPPCCAPHPATLLQT